jgi:hypothetical protein
MSKVLRKSFAKNSLFQETMFSKGAHGQSRIRQRLALDASVVCRPCNNDWMSQIDKLTKPVLAPILKTNADPRTLSPVDCATLASWMTVKSVVLDSYAYRYHGQRAVFFTPAQCAYVKTRNVPPSNVTIWLGRMTKRGPTSGNLRATLYTRFAAQHLANLTAFVCTLKINEVWIQLIARRTKLRGFRVPKGIQFTTQPTSGTWDDLVVEIWPNIPDAVDWPLPHSLGDDSVFNLLANRLSGRS